MKILKWGIVAACFLGLTAAAHAHGCAGSKHEKPAASKCDQKCSAAKDKTACAKKCTKKAPATPAKK